MARTVRGPDGRTWRVRRRWVSHRVRWRGRRPRRDDGDWLDLPVDLPLDDEFGCLGGIAIAVAVVGLIVLSVFFVFPAVIFAIEVLILVLLVGGGVVARFVLRRPWTIEAGPVTPSPATGHRSWQVVGWKASGQLLDRISQDITSGVDPR